MPGTKTVLSNAKMITYRHLVSRQRTATHTLVTSVLVRVELSVQCISLSSRSLSCLHNENKCTYGYCHATLTKHFYGKVYITLKINNYFTGKENIAASWAIFTDMVTAFYRFICFAPPGPSSLSTFRMASCIH